MGTKSCSNDAILRWRTMQPRFGCHTAAVFLLVIPTFRLKAECSSLFEIKPEIVLRPIELDCHSKGQGWNLSVKAKACHAATGSENSVARTAQTGPPAPSERTPIRSHVPFQWQTGESFHKPARKGRSLCKDTNILPRPDGMRRACC